MTLKSYLWGIRIVTIISILAFGLVLYWIDPTEKELTGKVIFYIVLFFTLSGIFNLLLVTLRRILLGNETAFMTFSLSFRQAMLLALLASGLLFLQSFRILIWWDALLITAGILMLELYFLSKS